MKPIILLFVGLCLNILLYAQSSKTVNVTSGGLSAALTPTEFNTITNLTLIGTIDAWDFTTIQGMPLLAELDMSQTTITATSIPGTASFPANWFPGPSIWKNSLGYGGLSKPLLTRIELPSTLEVIGSGALSGSSGLTSITIPPTVTTIGWSAFEGCTGLTKITIPPSVTEINECVFSNCTALKEFTIPTSMTHISKGMFAGCSGFTSLTIPSSVTSIGTSAFTGCSGLTSLVLPASIEYIGNTAFMTCQNLTSIYSYRPVPANISNSFLNAIKSSCLLYVPFGSKALYATADEWKDFLNIVEMPASMLSATNVSVASTRSSKATEELTTQFPWVASSDQTWLTVSPTVGMGNQILTFTAEENLLRSSRTAMVSISVTGANSQTITITQEANTSNKSPVANAGVDQSVNEGAMVLLDGSASSDPDKDTLTYFWTTPEGIILSSATNAKPTFTAPQVSSNTKYTFSLVVNDGTTNSITEQVIVTVKQVNKAPVVNAGADQSVNERAMVHLDGTASSDPDKDTLTYIWSAPEGIILSSTTNAKPTFTAPEVMINTEYTFTLVVNDGSINSTVDQVMVTVKQVNKAPVANAGADQLVNEGAMVLLDGSASSDTDKDALTYLWTAPEGITLSSGTNAKPTFIAPQVSVDTKYTFSLVVNDGTTNSSADMIVITNIYKMPELKLSQSTATLEAKQGTTATVEITSDFPWTASCDQTWLTVNPSSGTGNKTFTIIADANPALAARTATITVNIKGADSKTIVITQQTMTIRVNVTELNIAQFKCYPNPFSQEIVLEIQNPKQEKVKVDIYNMAGQLIKNLLIGSTSEQVNLSWNGTNDGGQQVLPGVYVCKMNNESKQLIYTKP